MQKKRYLELDALRGAAALLIVFFHYTLGKHVSGLFNLGVTAVDLFFLISGFVIFMSINTVSSGKEFVINRVSRLYPTYWFCVTFTFVMILFLKSINFHLNHSKDSSITDYMANMTMFQYYFKVPDLDTPYWTMIIEMLFYILILVLYELKLLKHINLIGCLINVLIISNFFLVKNGYIPNYNHYFPLVNHFALFFGGIIFYKIATNAQNKLSGYAIIIFCMITQMIIFKFAGSDPDHINLVQYICMLALLFLTFYIVYSRKLKFIVSKPTVFLGKISFALYLIHSYTFRGVIGFLQKHHFPFWIATACITVPLAILLAYLITEYVEKPFSKKLKLFLKQNFLKSTPLQISYFINSFFELSIYFTSRPKSR